MGVIREPPGLLVGRKARPRPSTPISTFNGPRDGEDHPSRRSKARCLWLGYFRGRWFGRLGGLGLLLLAHLKPGELHLGVLFVFCFDPATQLSVEVHPVSSQLESL